MANKLVSGNNSPTYVYYMDNPITGTPVALVPPFPYFDPSALVAFTATFNAYCQQQYNSNQDPSLLSCKTLNWADSDAVTLVQQQAGITSPPATPTAAP